MDHPPGPVSVERFQLSGTYSGHDEQEEGNHTSYVIAFIESGSIQLQQGVEVLAEGGCAHLIPAGVSHRHLEYRELDCWLVNFCAECVGLTERSALMEPFRRVRTGAVPLVRIAEARRAGVRDLIEGLKRESRERGAVGEVAARAWLTLLLTEICRASPIQEVASSSSLVSDTLAWIQEHAKEPISLSDVSAAVHRSPAHLTSTIKKHTGRTVGQWIAACRLEQAASRLLHTDETIDRITWQVGWGDTTHFIRQFKKYYGQTPAQWRKSHQVNHRKMTETNPETNP